MGFNSDLMGVFMGFIGVHMGCFSIQVHKKS